jgi:hypothetical protein
MTYEEAIKKFQLLFEEKMSVEEAKEFLVHLYKNE